MSSILKALKKAEQDGSLHTNNPDLKMNVQRIFDAEKWTSAPKKYVSFPKFFLAAGILIVVSSLCFYILSPQEKSGHERSQELSSSGKITSETTPAPPGIKPAPESAVSDIKGYSSVSEPVDKKTPEKSDVPVPSNTLTTQEEKPHSTASDVKSAPENISADEPVKEIKDELFKVQAISWAKTPEDRICVINNNVMSEKEYIQDYQILTIGKDEIILEKSGTKFRLKFRYR